MKKAFFVEKIVEVLDKKVNSLSWQYKRYPNETHYTTALPALYDGLTFLTPNYFTDFDALLDMKDYKHVFSHFKEKKKLWSGFRFEWLQSYTLAKYFFVSQQHHQIIEALKEAAIIFPESIDELNVNFALGFNKKKMFKQAKSLLTSIEKNNKKNAKWHYQISLFLEALNEKAKANKHHQNALKLAKIQQLESWEYWELEPYRLNSLVK